jgi:WS/DGAT/MGAT family acyltransferase
MQVLLLMAQTSPDKELMRDPVETSVRTQSTATLPASHPVPSIRSSQSEANDAIPINSVPKQEEKPALSSGKNGRKPVPQTRTEPALGNHSLFEVVAAMLRIVFRRPDPKTIFKGEIGKNKRAAWSRPFDAQEIKRIAHLKQATSNDVLLAVAARAFRRYLEQHNQTGHKNIRAFVMVNLRRRFFDEELGNKFGLVFLSLPMDCQPALECLTEVKHKMDDFKASAEYMASYQLLNILGQFPEWVENLAVKILDSKGTIVATNVSGLRRQLYLAGAPIQSVMAWVPQAGRIGLGLSIVGYNNEVRIGINTDARIIPDPDVLIDLFTEEYEAFVELLPANEK